MIKDFQWLINLTLIYYWIQNKLHNDDLKFQAIFLYKNDFKKNELRCIDVHICSLGLFN